MLIQKGCELLKFFLYFHFSDAVIIGRSEIKFIFSHQYPCHMNSTTLAREKAMNPYLRHALR